MLRCLYYLQMPLNALQSMRSAGIYLIQAEVGSARFCNLPSGEITITFRVGRSSASACYHNPSSIKGEIIFNSLMQLNVDSTALEAQRCSLTFSTADKHVHGIVLISLPKDKNLVQSTYRLTQNEDKRAEVDVKIKISLLDSSSSSLNRMPSQQLKSESSLHAESVKPNQSKNSNDNLLQIYVNNLHRAESTTSIQQSNINVKSKISEEYSQVSSEERKPRSFKVMEEDRVIQTTQSQLKRYKDEKQVYYQLYQLQKGKNEVAAKFISNLLKKIVEKCPALASIISEQSSSQPKKSSTESQNGDKKPHKSHQQQQQADSAMIAQLEQANRSLHRQVEEYKRLVEQMKMDLVKPKQITSEAKYTANLILPGLLDLSASKSTFREKSSIRSPREAKNQKSEKLYAQLKQVDFNKWLNLSIGQREEIQALMGSLAHKPIVNETLEKKEIWLKKLKAKLDKSFATLLAKKDLTKDALLDHKKEVNKFFEEILNF